MYFVLSTLFLEDKNSNSPKKNEPFLLFFWSCSLNAKCAKEMFRTNIKDTS